MYHFPTVETAIITQPFGVNKAAYARFGLKGHNGIDYGAPIESNIYACADGVVVLAEEREHGYGRHIRIQHDDYLSIYGHLQFMNFRKGDKVKAGDILGGMGGNPRDNVPYDGNSTGTHLHFEIRPDGEPANNGFAGAVDPMEFLLKDMPYKYTGRITAQRGLNVRLEPSVKTNKLYVLKNGETFKATKMGVIIPNQKWFKLLSLRDEWIAAQYYDNTYAEYDKVEETVSIPEPVNGWNDALDAAMKELEKLKRA